MRTRLKSVFQYCNMRNQKIEKKQNCSKGANSDRAHSHKDKQLKGVFSRNASLKCQKDPCEYFLVAASSAAKIRSFDALRDFRTKSPIKLKPGNTHGISRSFISTKQLYPAEKPYRLMRIHISTAFPYVGILTKRTPSGIL